MSDTGRGMTDEEIRHITEPFYRTDRARSRADGGAGLGLTLCRRIVEAHGGAMEFFSRPGEGTTVKIKFDSGEINWDLAVSLLKSFCVAFFKKRPLIQRA